MERENIIAEIRRTAAENDGVPLGVKRFEKETGITVAKWRGRYWRNWSDAVLEAGLEPNAPNARTDDEYLINRLTRLTQELGFFPTYADVRLARQADNTFPTHHLFSRLGSQKTRVELVRQCAITVDKFKSVLKFLPEPAPEQGQSQTDGAGLTEGFVYMGLLQIGSQKRYKIGKAILIARRIDQISIQLPEELKLIHQIKTDDAFGIEKYWHDRFSSKNTKGEWFDLSQNEIRAFKKRNFM